MRSAWIAVWNGDRDLTAKAHQALRSMADVHPDLSSEVALHLAGPAWCSALGAPGAGAVHVTAPDGVLAVVDGLAVTSEGRVLTARAVATGGLGDPAHLEGQFGVVRCTPDSIEVANDAFGMRQVFAWEHGRCRVLASSVELISRTVDGTLDEESIGLYVAIGWVPGDRTLVRGVTLLPGGRHDRHDRTGDHRGSHFRRASLAGRRRWRSPAMAVVEPLEAQLRALASHAGSLYVPLSAGMDSRLIAALVAHADVSAAYYTVGSPDSPDARTAPVLASAVGAEHHFYRQTAEDIVSWWPRNIERYVALNDGMTSMWVMGDQVGAERIAAHGGVIPQGVAGELARWNSWSARSLYRPGRERSAAFLLRRMERIGITKPPVLQGATAFVDQFLTEALDEGFPSRDLEMVWRLSERHRRWGGANNRKLSNLFDVYTPLSTRPFVEAAFQVQPDRGVGDPIHHQLIRRLAPPLYAIPPEQGHWPVQVPLAGRVVDRVRARRRPVGPARSTGLHGQHLWLDRLRHQVLARHFDGRSSVVWEVVDRGKVEQVLRDDDPSQRRRGATALLALVTVLEYEHWRATAGARSLVASPAASETSG